MDEAKKKTAYIRTTINNTIAWKVINLDELNEKGIRQLIHEINTNQNKIDIQSKEIDKLKQNIDSSKDLFEKFYDLVPIAHFSVDKNSIVTQVNLAAANLLMSDKATLIGKPVSLYIPKDSQPFFFRYRQQVLNECKWMTCEITMINSKSDRIPVEIEFMVFGEGENKKLEFFVTNLSRFRTSGESIEFKKRFENIIFKYAERFIGGHTQPEVFDPNERIINGFNEKILSTIREMAQFTNSIRSYILLYENEKEITATHEWLADGIKAQFERLQCLSIERFPWHMESLKSFETIQVSNVDELSMEHRYEIEDFHMKGCKSFIAAPMVYEKNLIGIIGVDSTYREKKWTEDELSLIKFTANIITSSLLLKKQYKPSTSDSSLASTESNEEVSLIDIINESEDHEKWICNRLNDSEMQISSNIIVEFDNTIKIACPRCLNDKTISLVEIEGEGAILEAICPCSNKFAVKLEFRKSRRKNVNFEGIYAKFPPNQEWDKIIVKNISTGGIGFITFNKNKLKKGEKINIKFALNDNNRSKIRKKVIVCHINQNYAGCEFIGEDPSDKALSFYLNW
ncbi:MAG: PilZ domain-containing protein [Desulfobacterales bacterium]|nr:PilZ domain-containing protein [Desulfobacterales bacterium]